MMKQRFTKIITLLAMAFLIVSNAFAQGKGGSDYETSESAKGSEWELLVHNGKSYNYFKGSPKVDGFKMNDRVRLGFHWKGNRVEDVENDTLYLCNVATGEYMQIGEYWGETSMINHVGLPYLLDKQTTRPSRNSSNSEWSDFEQNGYWIAPAGVRESRVVGRMNVNDGKFGHFEYNKFLALRDKTEYDTGQSSGNPGGFFFEFFEVPSDNGKVEYIIYTHRRTNRSLSDIRTEYFNRDSYLLLTNAGPMTADYNSVRFVKFAGQMYGADKATVTFSQKGTATTSLGVFSPSNEAANTFTANLRLSNGTTVPVTVTADGAFMGVSNADSNDNYLNSLGFYPTDKNVHTITISVPESYVIKSYSFNGLTWTRNRKFIVNGDTENMFTSDMTEFKKDNLNSRTTTFTIQVDPSTTDNDTSRGLYFTNFNVVLESTDGGDSNVVPLYGEANNDKNTPIGDEVEHYNQGKYFISLDEGLTEAAKDENNRWKLVTKKERDRFRLVASEDKPVDMSSKIVNPKFYTSFNYNWAVDQCSGPDANGHYTHPNEDTDFGWQWFDRDAYPHSEDHHHVHPYNITYSSDEKSTSKVEHHKVGTGHFWRTGHEGAPGYAQEMHMTGGQEANYSGSIFKGSANLQQKITGLREGLYLLYVRGFYAPHDMTQYSIGNWEANNTDVMPTMADWRTEARVTIKGEEMWRRSHDSYLFAWSYPNGKKDTEGNDIEPEEVRRMLPSIYEGAIQQDHLGRISKYNYINLKKEDGSADSTFIYTQLGLWYHTGKMTNGNTPNMTSVNAQMYLVRDENVFARYQSDFFNTGESGSNWIVPKTVTGAARFFNAVGESDSEGDTHANANNYRIGLPVYVGPDGELVIGVDHTYVEGESFENEWVCFDDFELHYMGKVEPDEFVIDELDGTRMVGPFKKIDGETGEETGEESTETLMKNNTQWEDIFGLNDITHEGINTTKVKTVVLRRTMPVKGWSSIVLPVSLKLKHVKEMFGDEVNVSKLSDFVGRTITYEDQLKNAGEEDFVMLAGVPYIVRPSMDPVITEESGLFYERPVFTKAYSTTHVGVAGWYLKDETRNYQVERKIAGPVWVASEVDIVSSESFPDIKKIGDGASTVVEGDGTIWATIRKFEKGNLQVQGKPELGKFRMEEFAVYEPGKKIPANSYYWANGKMYYTTTEIPKEGGLPRGLYSYIQMISENDGKAYAKQFISGSDYFIEVIDEPTGIEDINRPMPDGKIEIYDLQGRKVSKPGRGIYIMNGQKVLFK